MIKRQISLKQAIVTAVLVLLIASILTSVISKTVLAQSQEITLVPNQGPPGTTVLVNGRWSSVGMPITISINGVKVATTQSYGFQNFVTSQFTVPSVALGTYTVTASDSQGDSATASFTVAASGPSPAATLSGTSPASTSGGSSTNPPYYTYQPQTPVEESAGFWSPAVIAVVGVIVAVAVIIPVTFMLRTRSPKHETLLEKEPLPYQPNPYSQSNRPTPTYNQPTSRYNQSTSYGRYSTKPVIADRYSQPVSNVQKPTSGRTCPHCKKIVTGDYNICPYCFKKMR